MEVGQFVITKLIDAWYLKRDKKQQYLEVAPEGIQWITMESPVTYTVTSNRKWNCKVV